MGQEVGVTPLQLVSVTSAVANGGFWIRPHIVRDEFRNAQSGGGARRILSEETAAEMRKMLALVVTNGTAKTAQLNGYTSAGKTGTAQKIDPRTGTYSRRDYVASFVGYAPAESPLFTILVVVDSPRGKIYGGDVAAPVFKRIAEQILSYRNIPPSLPVKPALVKAAWKGAKAATLAAEPDATAELPSSGDDAEDGDGANGAAMLSLDTGVAVPSFVGKTVRAVAEQSQLEGLAVRMIGSGIAYQQWPSPGGSLRDSQKITVWFKVGGTAGLHPEAASAPQPPHGLIPARRDGNAPQTGHDARHEAPWPPPSGLPKTGVVRPRPAQPASDASVPATG